MRNFCLYAPRYLTENVRFMAGSYVNIMWCGVTAEGVHELCRCLTHEGVTSLLPLTAMSQCESLADLTRTNTNTHSPCLQTHAAD